MSLRPAWSTEQVPGQAPKLQRNSVLKNQTKPNRTKTDHILSTYNGTVHTLLFQNAGKGNTGPKQDGKPAGQTTNSACPCLMSKRSSDLQLLPALSTAAHYFSWAGSTPLTVFLDRYPMALTSLTSSGLQDDPGFSFTASHNGLSGLPFRVTSDTCLVSGGCP